MDGDKVLAAAEQLDGLVGILTSYRGKLLAAGFNQAIAEQMCVQFHGVMIAQAFGLAAAKKR